MNRTLKWIWYSIILAGAMLPFWIVGYLIGFFWVAIVSGFLEGTEA